MYKPYAKMTPREHIIQAVVGRIKCGRASRVHEAIEGYVREQGGQIQQYYENASYNAVGQLIKAIERQIR